MPTPLSIDRKAPMAAMEFKQHRETLRYKPHPIKTLENFVWEAKRIIGNRAGILRPSDSRRFVTFGSCFAENVAKALASKGANVKTTFLVEDVNCPHNNLMLLRRVFLGEGSPFTDNLANVCGISYDALRDEFTSATDIVFTLGNIYRLAGDGENEWTEAPKLTLVRESYPETVKCIQGILRLLREHTVANIFVSVSPVPISGYQGDEFPSAFEADCASKSQLRAAITECGGFTYIPTFEIFRWLGAHQDFSSFADNGYHPRHIDRLLIDAAVQILC